MKYLDFVIYDSLVNSCEPLTHNLFQYSYDLPYQRIVNDSAFRMNLYFNRVTRFTVISQKLSSEESQAIGI